MTSTVLYTILSLSFIGVSAASLLYIIAQKFKVYEDPQIEEVDEILPGANCGGCGSPGCKPFAEQLVQSDDISEMFCPVGGNDVMGQIAELLGKVVKEQDPQVAVLRCQGSCDHRPKTNYFDGPSSCQLEAMVYAGETDCSFGCLGSGDCAAVCKFDAMYMEDGIPIVITENCTACNACVVACPKNLLELRPKNKRDLKIYVACANEDKGGIAKKACDVACIGCKKCLKACPKDAITIDSFLAYIDPETCTLCRKCVDVCPTHSIIETNFPKKKVKKKAETDKKKAPADIELKPVKQSK